MTNRTISHLAYASGRLYCLTNLGAVAAIDAYSGSIIWLNIYPRAAQQNPNMIGMTSFTVRPTRPWSTNPAIVQDGKVFCLPADGSDLMIYDAADGSIVNALHLADCGFADTLVGVSGEKLVVTGHDVRCMNWRKYVPGQFGPAHPDYPSMLLWASAAKSPDITGRAFMTADSVFVSTRDHAYRFDMTTGKVVEVYPTAAVWRADDGEGPGNIIVTSDKVVIAGSNRVNVYTDLGVATARLEHEIAQSPRDPEPRLRYADVMFVSDNVPAALSRLDEAINLMGGLNAMKPGAERDRIYATAMTFAQKLANRRPTATTAPVAATTTGPTDQVDEFFNRAAIAAVSPAQQVNYRAALARWAHQSGDFGLEVRLYQEMLSDASLRNVQVTDEERGAVVTAADLAEQRIAGVIGANGGKWYQPYEREARQALDLARAKADPAELLGIAQRYPNSSSATAAMIAAAEGFESSANPRQATQLLREMYRKHPESAEREKLLDAMARNYLLLPGHTEVAIGRLAQAARIAPGQKLHAPLKTVDGQTISDVTYNAAAEALKKMLAQRPDVPSLPDFALPIPPEERKAQGSVAAFKPEDANSIIAPVTSIVAPVEGFARYDRLIAFNGEKGSELTSYAVGQNKPLWVTSGGTMILPPLGSAWIGETVLIFSASEIELRRAESGNVVWKTALKSIPEAEMAPGAVDNAVISNEGNGGQQRIFVAGGGQLVINGAFQGRVVRGPRGQFALQPIVGNQPAAAAQPANGPEQIISVRPTIDRVIAATSTGRVFALDLPEGRLAWQYRVSRDHPIDRLLATDDFTVAKVSEDAGVQLIALDSTSGQIIRRTNFTPESANVPLNVRLSAGGMMVYSMPDRIAAKDLFEPGATATWEAQCQPIGSRPFDAMTQPEQMILSSGRIAAVCDGGASVRLYSLENGQELKPQGPGAEMSIPWITTKATSASVSLYTIGSHLYTLNAAALMSYELDQALAGNAGASPGQELVKDPDINLSRLFIGSDYLLAIGNDSDPNNTRVLAYRRANVGGRESGLLDYDPAIPNPSGIQSWQPVDGGLYYLAKDHKLHFLAGARK